jgi:hypothetical protein
LALPVMSMAASGHQQPARRASRIGITPYRSGRSMSSASSSVPRAKAALGWLWRNPRRSSMGFATENQVRTGLPAGGNRIRTIGSAGGARHPHGVGSRSRRLHACGESSISDMNRHRKLVVSRGTDGSIPASSSGESVSLPHPLSRSRSPAFRAGVRSTPRSPRAAPCAHPTVFTPQPRGAGGGAEFQRSRLLLPCHI